MKYKPDDKNLGNNIYDAEQIAAAAQKVTDYLSSHPKGMADLHVIEEITECLAADSANPEAWGHSGADMTLDSMSGLGETPADILCRLLLLYSGGMDGRQWILDNEPGKLSWAACDREQEFNLANLPLDAAAILKLEALLVGTWHVINIKGGTMELHSATEGQAHAQMFVPLDTGLGLEYWSNADQWRIAEIDVDEDADDE